MLPPPQTTSTVNIVAPSSTASPLITVTAVAPAVPYAVQSGKAHNIAAARIGKPRSSDALTGPQQWMSLHDFSVGYRRQIVLNYPDKAWVRCQNGMPQRAAHWSPRPAGNHFELRAMSETTFEADAAIMIARGLRRNTITSFRVAMARRSIRHCGRKMGDLAQVVDPLLRIDGMVVELADIAD
jgi:hypothetical protein